MLNAKSDSVGQVAWVVFLCCTHYLPIITFVNILTNTIFELQEFILGVYS